MSFDFFKFFSNTNVVSNLLLYKVLFVEKGFDTFDEIVSPLV